MLRPVNAIIRDNVGNIIHRGFVVTGEVTKDNGDGSYDVFIAGEAKAYPKIFTLARNPDLAVGDKVRILYKNGCKELPIILPPVKKIVIWSKMYLIDEFSDAVHQYSIKGWDLSTVVYDDISFSVHDQASWPQGFAFSSDGTKLYVIDWSTWTVYQYNLSTAWNLTTAIYNDVNYYLRDEERNPVAIAFSLNGSRMYVSGQGQKIVQFTLSTSWELATIVYNDKFFSITGQCYYPYGICFKSDGSKMYVMGNHNLSEYTGIICQYTLSTPWDVSTASYDNKNKDISAQGSGRWYYAISFNPDGTKFFVADDDGFVYQYALSTPWDIGTATFVISFNSQDSCWPSGMYFKPE